MIDIRDEHDAFRAITEGLKIAMSGAQAMSRFRPDTRDAWLMMAQTYAVCAESAYKLAEEAAGRSTKQ